MTENRAKVAIGSQTVELSSRPKHKAIKAVKNILTDFVLSKIEITKEMLAAPDAIDNVVQTAMTTNPELIAEISGIETTLVADQTIMLASGLSYLELGVILDEAYEDEYVNLYNTSVKVLGGDANHFFGIYESSMSLGTPQQKVVVDEPESGT